MIWSQQKHMSNIEALTIGPGCEVTMYYRLSLQDGTLADETTAGEPLTFTMGDGTLIQGLELALYGMKVGEKQCLSIDPRDAFGFADEDNLHSMPRSEFADDMQVEPGTIKEVTDETVLVDFNHPLAGFEVTFDVEILDIKTGAGNDRD